MENRMMFQDREEFLSALRNLAREGVPQERIRVET